VTRTLPATGFWLLASGFWLLPAQQPKPSEDLCVPPPGARPSLPAKLLPGQGRTDMKITTKSPKAQEFFNQGVAQMHSFWHYEAERSFLQAAQLDPDAPMPQWGIAMAAAGDFRPMFQLGDPGERQRRPAAEPKSATPGARGPSGLERAREAAAKARQLSANGNRLEQLYIAAVAARRDPDSKDRDGDYIRGLRQLIAEFPKEVEAKAYLALALMNGYVLPEKTPRPGTEEAVALLQEILKQDPDHVGAHHFVIHVLEGSKHAKDAWESCRRYPQLAPEIPHALHMPGHIYVQTDRWADAATAFDQCARKERELMAADQLYSTGHHGHNVHFLANTYCFTGNYREAMALSEELLKIRENPREASQPTNTRTAYRQGWFARMRTLVHFRQWDEILEGAALPEYPGPRERAWRHWARGLALAARGDTGLALAEAKSMDEQMKAWEKAAGSESPHLKTARLELSGHIQVRSGDVNKGLGMMERAADMELHLRYNEPPAYPRPVLEALGQAALEARQWTRAESAFRRALDQNPGSQGAKEGLAAALARSDRTLARR
jgi:tetratricopeptide (TPR) repeat protein